METQLDILGKVILAVPSLVIGVFALVTFILQMCDTFDPAMKEYFDGIDRAVVTAENVANYLLLVGGGMCTYTAYEVLRSLWGS